MERTHTVTGRTCKFRPRRPGIEAETSKLPVRAAAERCARRLPLCYCSQPIIKRRKWRRKLSIYKRICWGKKRRNSQSNQQQVAPVNLRSFEGTFWVKMVLSGHKGIVIMLNHSLRGQHCIQSTDERRCTSAGITTEQNWQTTTDQRPGFNLRQLMQTHPGVKKR